MKTSDERFIRKTLKKVAGQRVVMVLQPGNVPVIELAVGEDEDTRAALRTCHLRGWVEVVHDAIPYGDLGPDQKLPDGWTGTTTIYRLTEAGWHAINQTHAWTVAIFVVALTTLAASVVGLFLSS